jgi:hypothetical protein
VAGADGSQPRCIGCTDVVDGRDGVRIFQAEPSAADRPNEPLRKTGFTVYTNQSKDLAAWYPDGQWIFAGVEMPRHALKHHLGNSEVGMFNDLWAISADGKIWVQLTDFASAWQFEDATVFMPFQSSDSSNCPAGSQYAPAKLFKRQQAPYSAYAGSATQAPPPCLGTMRPTVGQAGGASLVPIAWGERVGLDPKYSWAGPLQLAMAEIAFVGDLPALANYRRNLTPTPRDPRGSGLWSNPHGDTQIGCGYEPWAFSRDNRRLGFASDVFLSTSSPAAKPVEMPYSEAFTDVVAWQWQEQPRLWDVTAYNENYAYQNNCAPGRAKYYGHWEEPMVFSLGAGAETIAFGSSANLDPPWNPMDHKATFGLEVWALRSDGSKPALRLTHFNGGPGDHWLAYPTATDPADNSLFITVVPGGQPGGNPPGAIYKIGAPPL